MSSAGVPQAFGLAVTTPPAAEPLELAALKAHLRITWDSEDALLAGYLAAARVYVEGWLGRCLIVTGLRLTLDRFPSCYDRGGAIYLPRPPLLAVASVKYYSTAGVLTTLSSSAYRVDAATEPGRLAPLDGTDWPSTQTRPAAVQIDYTAGYGTTAADVPATIQQALLLLAGHYWLNREAVTVGPAGAVLPMAVESLLSCEVFHERDPRRTAQQFA